MNYQPLFIIGAGRSGTNILRDTLTSIKGWKTWDCDEINLIWRHGNKSKPDDVFGPEQVSMSVRNHLLNTFDRFDRSTGANVIVEKTCANSLRIPFIDEVFPEARYVYIVRDGRDVTLSAAKRWVASVEPRYLLKKLKYVPLSDVPYYAGRFLTNRIHQIRSPEKRQASWGPRFPAMEEWVKTRPLIEVCAKQWASCVECSDAAFSGMSGEKWHSVKYEDLVTDPTKVLGGIMDWFGNGQLLDAIPASAIKNIRQGKANGWKRHAGQFTPESLEIMRGILDTHGYDDSP